jgi:hypothetical protein
VVDRIEEVVSPALNGIWTPPIDVDKLTYKDGWHFDLQGSAFNGGDMYIYCGVQMPNSRKPDEFRWKECYTPTVPFGTVSIVKASDSEAEALTKVFNTLLVLEMHEAGEWMRYEDKVVFDPHLKAPFELRPKGGGWIR